MGEKAVEVCCSNVVRSDMSRWAGRKEGRGDISRLVGRKEGRGDLSRKEGVKLETNGVDFISSLGQMVDEVRG